MGSSGIETPWCTMATACRMLGVSRTRVYQLLQEGKLVGRFEDKRWLISRRSLLDRIGQLRLEGV